MLNFWLIKFVIPVQHNYLEQ